MESWSVVRDLLIMLTAALVLGTVAEWLRQSAILGYLVAGTLIGPHALGLVPDSDHVRTIAELGVALLLFTIGLEFSVRRLRRLGRIALLGGSLQIVTTLLLTAGVGLLLGLDGRASIALGAIVAISSTACVLRILVDRGAMDSYYGRNATGILLVQDASVIPLIIIVLTLAEGGSFGEVAWMLGKLAGLTVLLIGGFLLFFKYIVPRLLMFHHWTRNRELPILLAIVMAIGSAYAAHAASLSPAIGAFIAGVMLGESPFAAQVRADAGAFRTVLVTLFFAAIGMLGDPAWAASAWLLVSGTVIVIVLGKALIVLVVLMVLRVPRGAAVASGLCLAQVGEFSFVLAETARAEPAIIDEQLFNLIVTTTIVTLFLTPFLMKLAPWLGTVAGTRSRRLPAAEDDPDAAVRPVRDILVIGYGPAGHSIVSGLYARHASRLRILELNAHNVDAARRQGLDIQLGDAAQTEVLEHAGVRHASVIAITIPDTGVCKTIITRCRDLAPNAVLVVRSRYHQRRWELEIAGAREIVDEELQVGLRMAALARRYLGEREEG